MVGVAGYLKKHIGDSACDDAVRTLLDIADQVSDSGAKKPLRFKRYGESDSPLYGMLRRSAAEILTLAEQTDNKPNSADLKKISALQEMLAQRLNFCTINGVYDIEINKLREKQGYLFEEALPNQGVETSYGIQVRAAGGVGAGAEGAKAVAKIEGSAQYRKIDTINYDDDLQLKVQHPQVLQLKFAAKAESDVVDFRLMGAEAAIAGEVTRQLYTKHDRTEDALTAFVSNQREGYVHSSPIHFKNHRPDWKLIAEEEHQAINRATDWALPNLARSTIQCLRALTADAVDGLHAPARPFNDFQLLKGQAGASTHMLYDLLGTLKDEPLKQYAEHFQSSALNEPSRVYRGHHDQVRDVTSVRGQLEGKINIGVFDKNVNESDTNKIGIGVYCKLSGAITRTTRDATLIMPPHESIQKLGEYYAGGAGAALKDFLRKNSGFQAYAQRCAGRDNGVSELAADSNSFRELSSQMQAAKALLMNNKSMANPVLKDLAWKSFTDAHGRLQDTFLLPGSSLPADVPEEAKLVELCYTQFGKAWTALSTGLAAMKQGQGRGGQQVDTPETKALAADIKEVGVQGVHPLLAYAYSDMLLQNVSYKAWDQQLTGGFSFECRFPSPVPTYKADKQGPGAFKDMLKTSGSVGGDFSIQFRNLEGHPTPIRNGDRITATFNLNIELPSFPVTPNPVGLIKKAKEAWVDGVSKDLADNISASLARADINNAGRSGIQSELKDQLLKIVTAPNWPSKLTLTYERQYFKPKGGESYDLNYSQFRLRTGKEVGIGFDIGAYAGWGFDLGVRFTASTATTLASHCHLGDSWQPHILQYKLGPLVKSIKSDGTMNWEDLLSDPRRRGAVSEMYFSSAAFGSSPPVLDLLEKCMGRGRTSALVDNLLEIGRDNYRDKWENLTEIDVGDFNKVRKAVEHMNPTQRLHYFLETDEGRRLFQHYLDRLLILNACNDAGKISPQREAWGPSEGWKPGAGIAQRQDTMALQERLWAYKERLENPDMRADIGRRSEDLLRRLESSGKNGHIALIEELNESAKRPDALPTLRLMADIMNSGSGICGVGAESAGKFRSKLQVLAAEMAHSAEPGSADVAEFRRDSEPPRLSSARSHSAGRVPHVDIHRIGASVGGNDPESHR
jgi:hypothetical protein